MRQNCPKLDEVTWEIDFPDPVRILRWHSKMNHWKFSAKCPSLGRIVSDDSQRTSEFMSKVPKQYSNQNSSQQNNKMEVNHSST